MSSVIRETSGTRKRLGVKRAANSNISVMALACAAFCVTVCIFFLYRPQSRLEQHDPAIYDYIAQSILRGQVPYRDVIDPKGPGAMYVSAAAMALGRRLGIQDILAVRYVYITLGGLLSALVVLVAERYLSSLMAAALAFLIPLIPARYSFMMTEGSEPKLVMMLFAMLALLCIARDRPFWAGVCSMLACICWQPGLMFAGVAFLIFSRYLTSWRDLRALRVVAGSVLPLALVLFYFHLKGALGDLWSWGFTYDYKVFMPAGFRSTAGSWGQIVRVVRERVFLNDIVFVEAAVVGYVLFAWERAQAKLKWRRSLESRDLYKDAILMPPLIYFAFCMLNFQNYPDTIPFFPFIGLFGAWFFVKGSRLLGSQRQIERFASRMRLAQVIPAIAIVLVLFITFRRAAAYRVEGWTLADEYREGEIIASYLSPTDRIYVHGPAEVLVLLDRPNLNPYIELNSGSDDYIARQRPGGFGSLIEEMEAARPRIVAMARLQNVRHRAELEAWVGEHYVNLGLPGLKNIYIRKSEQ